MGKCEAPSRVQVLVLNSGNMLMSSVDIVANFSVVSLHPDYELCARRNVTAPRTLWQEAWSCVCGEPSWTVTATSGPLGVAAFSNVRVFAPPGSYVAKFVSANATVSKSFVVQKSSRGSWCAFSL